MTDLNTYFQKHGLCAENILYIDKSNKNNICPCPRCQCIF